MSDHEFYTDLKFMANAALKMVSVCILVGAHVAKVNITTKLYCGKKKMVKCNYIIVIYSPGQAKRVPGG